MRTSPPTTLYCTSLPALCNRAQATANYAVHYMLNLLGQDDLIRQHIATRTSVTTGHRVMAWKDALGEPQRAS